MLLARLRVVCCGDEGWGTFTLLVRYKPGDLEFTVLILVARSLLVFVIVSTASVVASDSGVFAVAERRSGFQLAVERDSKAEAETGSYDKVRMVRGRACIILMYRVRLLDLEYRCSLFLACTQPSLF